MSTSEAKRIKTLEEENPGLKRLLAEKELETQALADIIKKFSEQTGVEDGLLEKIYGSSMCL